MLDRQALQLEVLFLQYRRERVASIRLLANGSVACTSSKHGSSDEPRVVTRFREGEPSQEPRHILVACRSEMITASLSELLADHGYGVTGVVASDRGRQIIEARPVALLVLAGTGDAVDIQLVRLARRRGTPILMLALASSGSASPLVDGQPLPGVSRGTLIATVHSMIGGPIDSGPIDPPLRAA
jgi:hypothetical protein